MTYFVGGAVIGSAVIGAVGGSKARKAGRAASAQDLAFQQQMYQQQDPFSAGGNRQQYVGQLNELMRGGPSGAAQDPMYQWMQAQGQQAVERKFSASGNGGSGNAMQALMANQYGTANDYFKEQYGRLSSLSGASGGRTVPMQGMSAGDAYNLESGKARSMSTLFGAGMQGLAGIYGSGSGNTGVAGTGTGGSGYIVGGTQGDMLNNQWS